MLKYVESFIAFILFFFAMSLFNELFIQPLQPYIEQLDPFQKFLVFTFIVIILVKILHRKLPFLGE